MTAFAIQTRAKSLRDENFELTWADQMLDRISMEADDDNEEEEAEAEEEIGEEEMEEEAEEAEEADGDKAA